MGEEEDTTLSPKEQSSQAVIELQEIAGGNSPVIVRPSAKPTQVSKKMELNKSRRPTMQISVPLKNFKIPKKSPTETTSVASLNSGASGGKVQRTNEHKERSLDKAGKVRESQSNSAQPKSNITITLKSGRVLAAKSAARVQEPVATTVPMPTSRASASEGLKGRSGGKAAEKNQGPSDLWKKIEERKNKERNKEEEKTERREYSSLERPNRGREREERRKHHSLERLDREREDRRRRDREQERRNVESLEKERRSSENSR